MQINDLFHGFRVLSSERIDEIGAVLWRMEYEKNGAQLIWLERADDAGNKTFGIAFKTVPHDDTGVFHIIEHSVLCGSDKYPVREPFVELLKSSLATFLNAMTYPDKTVYPVSSRNDADFLNLMDVYLDAVFHPLSIRSPLAFRQEGWHWETGEGDDPDEVKCNGVVYNEMKGAYASADRMLGYSIDKLLFPDNCYSRSSGGDPAHIPELTYEMYLEEHRRFYSATNSRIFLDGMIDTEAVFSKLDACLSEYDRIEVDADIPLQKPVCPPEYIGEYAIGADEDPEGKVLAAEGWVFADYSEQEKTLAAEILADYLAGTNESPLSKAVLGRGLAEDISLGIYNGELQTSAVIRVKNTTDGNCDEIRRVTREVIENEIKHEQAMKITELEAPRGLRHAPRPRLRAHHARQLALRRRSRPSAAPDRLLPDAPGKDPRRRKLFRGPAPRDLHRLPASRLREAPAFADADGRDRRRRG